MRYNRCMNRLASVTALVVMVGCSSGSSSTSGIPGPGSGSQVNTAFDDVEPNNTPEQATPLGTASSGNVIIWVGSNDIGGSGNPADYFVFESGAVPAKLEFNMCYTPAIKAMTASLWKVVDGTQQTPPIATWTISNTCADSFTAPLEGSSVYLFGVLATGGAGTYTA